MWKRIERTVCIALSFVLLTFAFGACGSNTQESTTAAATTAAATTAAAAEAQETTAAAEEETTAAAQEATTAAATTAATTAAATTAAAADGVEAIPVTFYSSGYIGTWEKEDEYIANIEQKFYEDSGILFDINIVGTSHEESSAYISTKMAGGELDYVKSANPSFMQVMTSDGYWLPLDDLLAQYGQDMWNAVPKLGWDYGFINNQHYLMPYLGDYSMYVCTWVRWDLFEKSGFSEYPETVSEFANMIKTVMNDNPEKDLVGFTSRYPNWPWQHSLTVYYPAYDNSYSFHSYDDNGDFLPVIYGNNLPIYFDEPDYLDYLKQMTQWYQDGIIHNSLWTMDQTQYDALLAQGRLFAVSDGWDFQQTADRRAGVDPDVPLPAGQEPEDWRLLTHVLRDNGSPMVWAAGIEGIQTGYGAISSTTKYAEELIKFCNWAYTGEDVFRAMSWGVENQHWSWDADGKVDRVKDSAGTNVVSGGFGALYGSFYENYSLPLSVRYVGTEWLQIRGEKNKDWIGFFQDYSSLPITTSDTLTLNEMQTYAGECIVEILTTQISPEDGLEKLKSGIYAMGFQAWYDEFNAQYRAGMTDKFGENYWMHNIP